MSCSEGNSSPRAGTWSERVVWIGALGLMSYVDFKKCQCRTSLLLITSPGKFVEFRTSSCVLHQVAAMVNPFPYKVIQVKQLSINEVIDFVGYRIKRSGKS